MPCSSDTRLTIAQIADHLGRSKIWTQQALKHRGAKGRYDRQRNGRDVKLYRARYVQLLAAQLPPFAGDWFNEHQIREQTGRGVKFVKARLHGAPRERRLSEQTGREGWFLPAQRTRPLPA